MATLKGSAVVGGASALAVPAAAGVPSVDAVVLTDGEGAFLTSAGGLAATAPGATGQHSTAAANTAVTQTIAAVAAKSHRLQSLSVSYTGGTPAGAKVTVQDGATTILELDIVAAGPLVVDLPPGGLLGTVNTAMTISLAAGGVGVTGKVNTGRVTA